MNDENSAAFAAHATDVNPIESGDERNQLDPRQHLGRKLDDERVVGVSVPEFLNGNLARFLAAVSADNASGIGGYRSFEEDRRTVSRLTGIDDHRLTRHAITKRHISHRRSVIDDLQHSRIALLHNTQLHQHNDDPLHD